MCTVQKVCLHIKPPPPPNCYIRRGPYNKMWKNKIEKVTVKLGFQSTKCKRWQNLMVWECTFHYCLFLTLKGCFLHERPIVQTD